MTPEDRLALEQAGGLKAPPIRPPKIGKGPTAKRRAKKRRQLVKVSRPIRDHVLALDGERCRWPECETTGLSTYWGALEAAHYEAAGMGGDPLLVRYTPENLLTLCRWHHRGPHGLHSGDAKMEALDPVRGMRGPVEFFKAEGVAHRWYSAGVTEPPRCVAA